MIIELGISWVVGGALTYASALAKAQGSWPTIASKRDWTPAALLALLGPCGLAAVMIVNTMEDGRPFLHGLKWIPTEAEQ